MDWGNPNHIALFAGWGQWAGAVGSLLAVIIAVWVSLRSSRDSQRQSRQARYDAARPVLVISGNDPVHTKNDPVVKADAYISWDEHRNNRFQTIYTQSGKRGWIDWDAPVHLLTLQNIGVGTAFNVKSVLLGPESLNDNNKRLNTTWNDYWLHNTSILSVGEQKECGYQLFRRASSQLKRRVAEYSLLAPAQPIRESHKIKTYRESTYVCRVTTTYHDIFKRKHASIFDLDIEGHWVLTAILEDIPKDLHELQGYDPPSPVPLWRQHLQRFLEE